MNRTSKTFLFSIVLLLHGGNATYVLAADGPPLIRHKNTTARYEALMPAGVKDTVREGETLMDTRYKSEVEVDGAVFIVRMVLLSLFETDAETNKRIQDSYVGAARAQYVKQYKVQPERERDVLQHSAKGKDFLFNIRRGNTIAAQVRERVIFDGQRLYTASLIGNPSTVSSSAADRFMDSVGPLREVKPTPRKPEPKPDPKPEIVITQSIAMKLRVDQNYGFEIKMPEVSETRQNDDNQSLIAVSDETVFGIASIKSGDSLKAELKTDTLTQDSNVLENYLATKSGLKPTRIRHKGLVGFEVRGNVKNFSSPTRIRAFLTGTGLHLLFVSGPELTLGTLDANRFLDSFRIVNTTGRGQQKTESRMKNGIKYDVKY